MQIVFYNYRGKNDVINKSLELVKSVNATPYNTFDDENPLLVLGYDATIENCNYCVIDGTCYYIEVPSKQVGNRLELTLSKDLLTTYKTQLRTCKVILDRSSSDYNSYIYDNMQRAQVNYTTFSIPLGSLPFTGNSPIIISLIGGS